MAAAASLMLLLVARQTLVLAENAELLATVRQREEQLRYRAFHDPLTGLANRLFSRTGSSTPRPGSASTVT